MFACDFDAIDFYYRVPALFDSTICFINKGIGLQASDQIFHHDQIKCWLIIHGLCDSCVSVEHRAGSWQHMMIECVPDIYSNSRYYFFWLIHLHTQWQHHTREYSNFTVMYWNDYILLCFYNHSFFLWDADEMACCKLSSTWSS